MSARRADRRDSDRALDSFVDRLVVERHAAALALVDQLRMEDPTATVDELADRSIRWTARDLALAGALSGGAARRGPWSLAALVPYGIGAGVGALGNAVLARSLGRAAKQFFAAGAPIDRALAIVEDVIEADVELLEAGFIAEETVAPAAEDRRSPGDVVDAVVVGTDAPPARPGAPGEGR